MLVQTICADQSNLLGNRQICPRIFALRLYELERKSKESPQMKSSVFSRIFSSTSRIITASIILRLVLLVYGIYHDAHSPLKYTDVDYYVFTDAARYVHANQSPYLRETYRYTPLLAWLLIPTAWHGWFSFGKLVFAFGDVAAGWIMILILRGRGMSYDRSLKYVSIWLLNPMVYP